MKEGIYIYKGRKAYVTGKLMDAEGITMNEDGALVVGGEPFILHGQMFRVIRSVDFDLEEDPDKSNLAFYCQVFELQRDELVQLADDLKAALKLRCDPMQKTRNLAWGVVSNTEKALRRLGDDK